MHRDGRRTRPTARRRFASAAFSLPELMIALVILGLGMLIIAAALPAGLHYTAETTAASTGASASDYAMSVVTQRLRLSKRLAEMRTVGNTVVPVSGRRLDPIFRPRIPAGLLPPFGAYQHLAARLSAAPGNTSRAEPYDLATIPSSVNPADVKPLADWESLIKVRPMIGLNVNPNLGGGGASGQYGQVVENTEEYIRSWLREMVARNLVVTGSESMITEVDLAEDNRWSGGSPDGRVSLTVNPALPSTVRVFPPLPQGRYDVAAYFNELNSSWSATQLLPFGDQRVGPPYLDASAAEMNRIAASRFAWTVLYRRISYLPGSDPGLYELIVVVTRRPSERHFYVASDPTSADISAPVVRPVSIAGPAGVEPRLFPQPWLMVFDPSKPLPLAPANAYATDPAGNIFGDRHLRSDFAPPSRLVFYCRPDVGKLLPKGALFFPAVNDETINGSPSSTVGELAGFTPRATRELPIFEVVDRPDDTTVMVAFNGFYPWVVRNNPWTPDVDESWRWPVWVIPPVQGPDGGLDRKSPVVSVLRRVVRIPELRN
ncbi:MAG: prepilin-type N-terminal cleavage/methylation domain-containing protein [Planctomycetia bacterium]|nr:MAG: prepilin-type N-terminal cleavage/methylation domain-containing protein [Planctomycetia bacterium]